LSIEEIGGRRGRKPVDVGAVVITEYRPGARFRPRLLSGGEAVLALLPDVIPLRKNADFSLLVLKILTSRALILRTKRDEAEQFARKLLDFIDNPEF
jgi:hypothetical protein